MPLSCYITPVFKIKSSNFGIFVMREKIVALVACLIIFTTVLIIGVTTVVRSNTKSEKPAEQPLEQTVVPPAPTEITPPPPVIKPPEKKYRFKRAKRSENRLPFDFSTAARLPKHLEQYRYTAGILVDLDSRKVLWQHNSKKPVPIASLTKLLTIYTAFEEMEKREDITLKTRITVSLECTHADKVKINLKPGEKIPLNELFIYAMLRSANDAAHLIAEFFGNGENDVFIRKMNNYAALAGMTDSQFFNANGLPIYGQKPEDTKMNTASCLDMVKLIDRIYDYPKILQYTSLREINTPYGVIRNGNRLLHNNSGMEGLKTGYTNAAGNCLAFSCRKNGRRLVGVVTGFAKRQNCFDFTAKLLAWGFQKK